MALPAAAATGTLAGVGSGVAWAVALAAGDGAFTAGTPGDGGACAWTAGPPVRAAASLEADVCGASPAGGCVGATADCALDVAGGFETVGCGVAVGTTTGVDVGGAGVAVGAGFDGACVGVRLGCAFAGVAGTDVGVAVGAASAAVC